MTESAYSWGSTGLDHAGPARRLRAVLDFGDAIDLYIAELARRGKSRSTRDSYVRILNHFADSCRGKEPEELKLEDYERFVDRWTNSAASTLASGISCVKGFSRYLHERGYHAEDVAAPMIRPNRPRPEDVAVVTVSTEDVMKMLAACEDMQELLCLSSAIFLGARRAALARIRRSDLDLVNGTVRLLDKGGKESLKPLAREYHDILIAAERDGLWKSPDDYLIPNRRPAAVKRAERSDKIVWETVKRVARRAGVKSHVHALRAAFAVAFDAQHPGENFALKDLMGHTRMETTLIYLRRRDKAASMEKVRDLSWGLSVPSSQALKAHTGFEPVLSSQALCKAMRRRLAELTTGAKPRVPSP